LNDAVGIFRDYSILSSSYAVAPRFRDIGGPLRLHCGLPLPKKQAKQRYEDERIGDADSTIGGGA